MPATHRWWHGLPGVATFSYMRAHADEPATMLDLDLLVVAFMLAVGSFVVGFFLGVRVGEL